MRTKVVAILVLMLCALVDRGVAKAPHVVTVAGPGIDGEVDLGPLVGEGLEVLVLPLGRALTDRADPPTAQLPSGFTFAWYSVSGDPPGPGVDRLVYYPAAGGDSLVEVVETSPLFVPDSAVGWYRVDPATARGLDRAVAVAESGMRGALGYAYEPADASDYSEWWVPVGGERVGAASAEAPGRSTRATPDVTPTLAAFTALGVIAGAVGVLRSRRLRTEGSHALP